MSKKTASKINNLTINVSLRIDPKTKYLIDLMAREQKRTITGVVEWAIAKAAGEMAFRQGQHSEDVSSFLDGIDELWSSDEAVRLVRLASRKPDLLDYDEMRIWETIKASHAFWRVGSQEEFTEQQLDVDVLQQHWDTLLEHVARHQHSKSITPYKTSKTSLSPTGVRFEKDHFWVELSDGRGIGVPIAWFPRLRDASPDQRNDYTLMPNGIHWESVDEDISIAGLLAGRGDQTVRGKESR